MEFEEDGIKQFGMRVGLKLNNLDDCFTNQKNTYSDLQNEIRDKLMLTLNYQVENIKLLNENHRVKISNQINNLLSIKTCVQLVQQFFQSFTKKIETENVKQYNEGDVSIILNEKNGATKFC